MFIFGVNKRKKGHEIVSKSVILNIPLLYRHGAVIDNLHLKAIFF